MKLDKFIISLFYVGLLVFNTGCSNLISSAVESGIVYVVAKHDETVEKKQKKYTATDRCVVSGEPEAYAIGNAIAYGQALTVKYDRILSRTGEDIDPVQPHQLAYAFFIIADDIRDTRAKERMEWMEKQMPPKESAEVRSIMHDKFLASHLEKCFAVPDVYRVTKTMRQMIKEDQAELEQKNKEVIKH